MSEADPENDPSLLNEPTQAQGPRADLPRLGSSSSAGDSLLGDPTLVGSPQGRLGREQLPDGDRYEEIKVLGQGGMGRVVLARDRKLGREVAIKRILAEDDATRARFLREARTVAGLNHRNVVAIHDVGEDSQGLYLVMEYIHGATLARHVQDQGRSEGGLAHDGVVHLGRGICRGLGAAHRKGVIHRDLKPGNVMIDQDGEARVLDFGLAKAGLGGEGLSLSLSMTGAVMGTPDYMAPEQWASAKDVDHRADIYALGATLYFAATGRSPRLVTADGVTPSLFAVIVRCLQEDPTKRYFSADEVGEALASCRDAPSSTASGAAAHDPDEPDEGRCLQCGRRNPPDTKFCRGCGAGLQRSCPACGNEQYIGHPVCGGCGATLADLLEAERLRDEGQALIDSHRYGSALDAFSRAADLWPDCPQVAELIDRAKQLRQRCEALLKQVKECLSTEDFEQAQTILAEYVQLRPQDEEQRLLLDNLPQRILQRDHQRQLQRLTALEDLDERRIGLEALLKQGGGDSDPVQALLDDIRTSLDQVHAAMAQGKVALTVHDYEQAQSHAKQALAIWPSYSDALALRKTAENTLSTLLRERQAIDRAIVTEDFEEAADLLSPYLARRPHDQAAADLLADLPVRIRQRDYDRALADIRSAVDPALVVDLAQALLDKDLGPSEPVYTEQAQALLQQAAAAHADHNFTQAIALAEKAAALPEIDPAMAQSQLVSSGQAQAQCESELSAIDDLMASGAFSEAIERIQILQRQWQDPRAVEREQAAQAGAQRVVQARALAQRRRRQRRTQMGVACVVMVAILALLGFDYWRTVYALDQAHTLRSQNSPVAAQTALDSSGWLPWRTEAYAQAQEIIDREIQLQVLDEPVLDGSAVPTLAKLKDLERRLVAYRAHAGSDASRADHWQARLAVQREERRVLDIAAAAAAAADTALQAGSRSALKGWLQEHAGHPRAEELRAALAAIPNWATKAGQDRYGRWADLQVAGVTQRLRYIAPGTFLMGSSKDEQAMALEQFKEAYPNSANESWVSYETQHRVTLTQGYWLADSPCTQALWQAVMGSNPSRFTGNAQRPVEQVSWNDVQEFLTRLNRQVPGLNARLPSEAEWEYAARAGSTGARYGYLDAIAWYRDNSNRTTHPVKQKQPNAWGLYDMIGNVWEWCSAWYWAYSTGAVTNPSGPASGSRRVYRGGGWSSHAADCRAAYRPRYGSGYRGNDRLGFRFLAQSTGQEGGAR